MKQVDLDRALQLTFEIEGLVMLSQSRDESAPAEISKMLADKTEELAEIFNIDNQNVAASVELEQSEDAEPESEPEHRLSCEDNESNTHHETPATEEYDDDDAEASCRQPDTARNEAKFRLEDKIAEKAARELKHALTLNDRYRFSRELFGNSNDALNSALDTINDMETFDQAERWVADNLGLDSENEIVKEFMAIVTKHFNR